MEVKETKELHIGEYNSIMEIFRYNPVTYCLKCGAKKYSSYCKCNRLPIKIGNARVIDIEFVKFKKNLTREDMNILNLEGLPKICIESLDLMYVL